MKRICSYSLQWGMGLMIILQAFSAPGLQAQKFTISGHIEDKSTGERLIGANLSVNQTGQGTVSNAYGFFSLTLPDGPISLSCSYVGYKAVELEFSLKTDTVLVFRLTPAIDLHAVTIKASQNRSQIRNTQLSINSLSAKTIKELPVFLGEKDVLKTLQLLPGVQSGNEGTSGIYVRGGGPDQNLILLDGVPVYNVNHLFGFFSVFNPDALQQVTLIKGGFPARYGGRLSSVLDIRLKEGNNKKFTAEGSVGLISSKLTIEGPIVKDKTSYMISGRRTYLDVLARPIISLLTVGDDMQGTTGGYYFYDLSAKVNHRFSDRSRLYFSTYLGKDQAYVHVREKNQATTFREDFDLGWGNTTTALRWNYILSPKLFANTTLTYSDYRFITEMGMGETIKDTLQTGSGFSYDSGIRDMSGRVDFDYAPDPNHSVKFGLSHIFHTFRPGISVWELTDSPDLAPRDTSYGGANIYAGETELYGEDDWKIGSRVKLNFGLHASAFTVQDSVYYSLQPRLSGLFVLNEYWSVKAAYSHMSQNIHLLTNSTIGLPTDLWVPSTAQIKPQKSIQYALGTIFESPTGWELSLEGFYKSMANLIEYKEGASFFSIQPDWQDKLTFGRGRSFGGEFLIRKTQGKTTGWIGYSLSKSERQFEEISFGKWFPYRYDRRHDVSVVLNHRFNERIDLGITWVYATGAALTLPYESYQLIFWPGRNYSNGMDYFETRNSYRLPAYHRLDIGINLQKEKKWGLRTWSFGVYNAYNRQNPFYLNTTIRVASLESNTISYRQYSLFPIIPSISYSFKLK